MIDIFKNKIVLITGGTGSFGQAFAKRLLSDGQCEKVIIFSRDEWKQWEIQNSDPIFLSPKIRFFLGDIRDVNRLMRAFCDVDFVIHAAALKQVPAAEYNPSEFVNTNIIGAMNIIEAAINCRVKKVIALSTDKAVNPINLYGATKLCSDKLFCAGNAYVGMRGEPQFSVVRYGNVLGSRGSIIPLWQKMIAEGAEEIPITDIRMTRFWISMPEAVELVMQCFSDMRGGEIFVPKIPSMKISDLAQAIAPHQRTRIIGIRPGEKLHELMISNDDSRHTIELEKYYIILPEFLTYDQTLQEKLLTGRHGRTLPDQFSYSSENNTQWLDIPTLRSLLKEI